ncbi:hypothetical protein C8J56DRAFT_941922 [Mycena floridula]|nr:hypothetical protein C8J56DRAFT_941922 [Mycena floridula]
MTSLPGIHELFSEHLSGGLSINTQAPISPCSSSMYSPLSESGSSEYCSPRQLPQFTLSSNVTWGCPSDDEDEDDEPSQSESQSSNLFYHPNHHQNPLWDRHPDHYRSFIPLQALGPSHDADTGFRCHICATCGKKCRTPSSLALHEYVHTGEAPFKCLEPSCGLTFSVKSNMRRHWRTFHQPGKDKGPKPSFSCPHAGCRKSFTVKSNMERHFMTHSKMQRRWIQPLSASELY